LISTIGGPANASTLQTWVRPSSAGASVHK
jgi:hypothetical protein